MRHLLHILIALTMLTAPALAEDRPRAGLMWNQSGLPATLPLQIRTFPGKDYVLYLIDPDTDGAVMAGYIRGGQFFRLLVPPGTWHLRFAYGDEWQDEAGLFGDNSEWTELDEPLDFRASAARRHGHVVTLIERNGRMVIAQTDAQTICQIAGWDTERHGWDEARAQIGPLLSGEGQAGLKGNLRYIERSLAIRQIICG